MSAKKAIEHREIKHLTQILGLDPSLTYTREKALDHLEALRGRTRQSQERKHGRRQEREEKTRDGQR